MKSFKKERLHRTPISNADKGGTNEVEDVVGPVYPNTTPPCPSEASQTSRPTSHPALTLYACATVV